MSALPGEPLPLACVPGAMNFPSEENTMARIRKVDDGSFAGTVENERGLVLVEFGAAWCGPCRIMEPVLERLEAENEPPMKVVMLDVDNSPATASRFGVRGVPTFILFRDGAEMSRMVGAMPEPAFRARLRENLAESAA